MKFIPTQEWLDLIKKELSLNTINRLLKYLIPQIEELAKKNSGIIDELHVCYVMFVCLIDCLFVCMVD